MNSSVIPNSYCCLIPEMSLNFSPCPLTIVLYAFSTLFPTVIAIQEHKNRPIKLPIEIFSFAVCKKLSMNF